MLDGEIDTDIKTVADQDLPKPGNPEKISVRVLSKKKKAVELEVDSSSPVIVSGNNITIADLDDDDDAKESERKKYLESLKQEKSTYQIIEEQNKKKNQEASKAAYEKYKQYLENYNDENDIQRRWRKRNGCRFNWR